MNKIIFGFFLIFSTIISAQNRVQILGVILVKDAKPSDVRVVNLNSEREVFSDEKGHFTIEVQEDDVLVFNAPHLDFMRKMVEGEHLKSGKIEVLMTSTQIVLDEVEIVNYNRINAVSLGILSKPAKKYTPAERRLYGATSSPFDGLINSLSGRTKMLTNDVDTEKKQFALYELDKRYTDDFYIQTLKINPDDIGSFKYYVVEDSKFREALKGKNPFRVTFLMINLALEFKKIRNEK
ncbi:hypothetical protein [Flavobacterium sp.]|uniref:hypothetical protein n=1 Tax=Flavobacterium sp. TaxID=239 RepID=UPI002616CEA0|nr:hypothetical protein [Flavobacterium sp.]MDD3004862.1 hypothetical protein [Flavobacterium sp.]